ncbi:acetate kinase [bacterium]|nr:acetate kinase [bacterium]
MNILVINTGSSSLKFQIIKTDLEMIEQGTDKMLCKGLVERIGSQALVSFEVPGKLQYKTATPIRDHKEALSFVLNWMSDPKTKIPGLTAIEDIHAIGHRVVHGGEDFTASVRIDEAVIKSIEDNIDLAPLHNPPNLKGIYAAREVFGSQIPQIAIFDTSFHSTMPEVSYLYGIPYQFYRRYKIRKYGFHGTSHRYISYRYRVLNNLPREKVNIISLHLGNGASACAIKGGKSFDTSMGFTPLEGLMMGTRSGDIDPSIIEYISHKESATIDEVMTILNKRSGLLGISGLTHDMRDLEVEWREFKDRRAKLAIDMFAHKVKKYLGSYFVTMGGADAICFTAGIGENSALVRKIACEGLEFIGIELDDQANEETVGGKEGIISKPESKVKIYVIPTNEELILARDTCRVVLNAPIN